MRELIFEIIQGADGGYSAECLTEAIVTEGDTWEELRHNVKEAVKGFYFDSSNELPGTLRLHLVRDEVLSLITILLGWHSQQYPAAYSPSQGSRTRGNSVFHLTGET